MKRRKAAEEIMPFFTETYKVLRKEVQS